MAFVISQLTEKAKNFNVTGLMTGSVPGVFAYTGKVVNDSNFLSLRTNGTVPTMTHPVIFALRALWAVTLPLHVDIAEKLVSQ